MADEQLVIASAVLIPDQEELLAGDRPASRSSPRPTLKRSHENDEGSEEQREHSRNGDHVKRARLSSPTTTTASNRKLSEQDAELTTTTTTEPTHSTRQSDPSPKPQPRTRPPLTTTTEKTRNRRLFTNLQKTLVGIGQTVAQNIGAARKKEAVEKRAREKLAKIHEEDGIVRRRRLDGLWLERRREQVGVDGRGMRVRHRALRFEAGFLRTGPGDRRGEGGVFYLPYTLRAHEAERIRRQRTEVEDLITREETEFERHVERETDELLEIERRHRLDREKEEEDMLRKRQMSAADEERRVEGEGEGSLGVTRRIGEVEHDDYDDERGRDERHKRRRSGSVNVQVNVNVEVNVDAVNGGDGHEHSHHLLDRADSGDGKIGGSDGFGHVKHEDEEQHNRKTTVSESKGSIMEVEEVAIDHDVGAEPKDSNSKIEDEKEEEKKEKTVQAATPVVEEEILGVGSKSTAQDEESDGKQLMSDQIMGDRKDEKEEVVDEKDVTSPHHRGGGADEMVLETEEDTVLF